MKLLNSIAILVCLSSFNFSLFAAEDSQVNSNSIASYFNNSYLDFKVREKKSTCFDFTGTWISDIEGRVVDIQQDACDFISITEKDLGVTSFFKLGSWVMGNKESEDVSYITASRWVDENKIDGRFSLTTDLKNQTFAWVLSSISSERISINMLLTNPNFSSVQYDDFFSMLPGEEEIPEEINGGEVETEENPVEVNTDESMSETPAEAEEIS